MLVSSNPQFFQIFHLSAVLRVHTTANYLAFKEKGPGQERGARERNGGKGVGDGKGDWTGREREGTKRGEKWEICPGFGKAEGGNPNLRC